MTKLIPRFIQLLMREISLVTRRRFMSISPDDFSLAARRTQKDLKLLWMLSAARRNSTPSVCLSQPSLLSACVVVRDLYALLGLVVLERNYLDVYPYDKWAAKSIPEYREGEEFIPTVCELKEGATTAPSYLTEADLVSLMNKNGIGDYPLNVTSPNLTKKNLIGTDATMAQHIQTVIDREYVMERMEGRTKCLIPSTLGIGLVEGYNKIGFDKSLSKPQLRREVRPLFHPETHSK